MEIKSIVKGFALPVLLIASQANAASISFFLNQSNATSVLPNGVNYAQVTISDNTTVVGDIDFDVQIIASAFTAGSNFGMQTFSFNYDTSLTVGAGNITGISPVSWTISQDANAGGGFGKFEFQLSGTGSARTSVLGFTISGVAGDSINDYAIGSTLKPGSGNFFASHIAGFVTSDANITSAQFSGSTPAVPVPAAVWLFGSGLLGLVGVARRRG